MHATLQLQHFSKIILIVEMKRKLSINWNHKQVKLFHHVMLGVNPIIGVQTSFYINQVNAWYSVKVASLLKLSLILKFCTIFHEKNYKHLIKNVIKLIQDQGIHNNLWLPKLVHIDLNLVRYLKLLNSVRTSITELIVMISFNANGTVMILS